MAARPEFLQETWYYSREQIENSPSRKYGLDQDKELSYRQQAANLIQDMGQRLTVNQLCINTGIVYMHRFYMVHSFTKFHRNVIAPACLFLGAKVEEQPRKLEHVVRVAYACLNRETQQQLNPKSEQYSQLAQELVINESIILQTLGFEIAVDHPHTHVVKCTQLIRASKDLSQTSYFMATNSLHLTTFCLRYKPTAVACACIYLSAKWSKLQIPKSSDGKDFWEYVDKNLTSSIIEEITREFIQIIESSPNRLKRKLALKQGQSDTEIKNKLNEHASTSSSTASIFDEDEPSNSQHPKDQTDGNKSTVVSSKSSLNLTEYKMMKEKEIKREKEKARQRESQKVDEQHSNHNRLSEHGKQKDPNIRIDHHGKHTESRPNDGQVKQREGHSSRTMNDQVKSREGHSGRSMHDQVKHGDHKVSSLHTPEKVSDTRSQGHGDAHRTQDRSRSHHHAHKPQSHVPASSERPQSSIKPSSKDVRPPDHKKDVRHRHHHSEKKSHEHHKITRPVDELRLHDQRHRSELRHHDGHEKVDMLKDRHLQENPAKTKETEEYILMKPDSLVEMDILGALKEECASPHIPGPRIPSPHVPSPHVPNRHVPMSQSLSKVVKDQPKQDAPVERVPDHQSLIEESIQGLNKKEAMSQQNLSKDRRKRSMEPKEAKVGKVKHEPVRSEQKGKMKLEQVPVKSEPVIGRPEQENPDNVKVRPDHIKIRPEQVIPRPVQVIEKSEHLTIRPEQPKVKPDQVKARSDHVKVRPEQVSVKPEQGKGKFDQGKVKNDHVKGKPENVKVRSEQVTVKTEPFMMKPEQTMVKLESLRLKREPKAHQDSISASPVKVRKDILHQDSVKLELPSSPAKVQKDVHNQESVKVKLESPVKVRRDVINQDGVKHKSELLPSPAKIRKDIHSPGKSKKPRVSSKPVMHEASTLDLSSIGIGNFLTSPELIIKEQPKERKQTPPKVKREHTIPMVKKETAVKLDFNSTPALQKIKSEPTLKPVAPPKKRIKNMMQTQSQPAEFNVQQLKVAPQQTTHQQIQKTAPPEVTSQVGLKQPVQQQPELAEVESWSHMMHPAEILDSNDFMNDMKHETTHLDDLSLGTGLFDFQNQSLNLSSVASNLELKDPEPKLIHKDVHPAEILENSVPAKKSKPVKKETGISQLEFDPHPAEIFENVGTTKVKEPSEDGELVADDSLVHPTEIENPALLRVKNEEPVMLKASSLDHKEHSSDHERRSSDHHRHSDHKRHSKHKHSSKKKDKDRHRSKDRSSSRSREDHSSEIRHSSNGNEVGPSVQNEPVSVLTTSEGIKLKIKLGNSFSEKQASPSAGSSPLSMKIDLKKMRDYDSKHDKERKKDKSSRHHKHKSHKRSHSPLESSTGDAPASPAKRRATNIARNSLLNLPMPPADPKKKSKHSLSNGESPASNVYNFN